LNSQNSLEGALIRLSTDKQKILVVDDEVSIRRILALRLSMVGYDVVTASDGEEALKLFVKPILTWWFWM
jgi:OmpR family response regulator RpaB